MSAEDLEKWRGRTKPGMPPPSVPADIREAFILGKGIDWTASYIDPAAWVSSSRAIICKTHVAYDRITSQASFICEKMGVNVRKPTPAQRMAA